MKCEYLKNRFQFIEDSIKKVDAAGLNDPQLTSMLCSYLVVVISGIYEDCIECLFIQRAAKSHDKELEHFVEVMLHKHFRNPDFGKIKEFVKALDPGYAKKLDVNVSKKSIDGLNSIVEDKNDVAHGKFSYATLNDVRQYHTSAIEVFVELEKILL